MRRDATGNAILNGMAMLVKNSMHKSRYINETAASFMYDVVCFAIFVVCELLYTKVENKQIKYVTNDEIEANQILNIFKTNQVTPINSEEVIVDLFRNKF